MTVKIYSNGWKIGKTIRAYTSGAWQKIKTMRIYRSSFLDWVMVYPDVPAYSGTPFLSTARSGGGVPDQVQSITGTTGKESLTLFWIPPLNQGGSTISSYRAQLGTASSGSWISQRIYSGPNTSVSFLSLIAGTQYWARVRSKNAAGNSLYLVAGPWIPYREPNQVSGLSGNRGDKQVNLSWITPFNGWSPITGYVVEYQRSGASGWNTVPTGSTSTAYLVSSLINGIQYIFKVAAQNAAGTGPFSDTISRMPAITPTVTASKVNGITVNWSTNDTTNIQNWVFERRLNSGAWIGQQVFPSSQFSTNFPSPGNGTHEFRVLARYGPGDGDLGYSNAVSIP